MIIGRQFLIITLRSTAVFLSSLSAIMTLNTWITDCLAFTVNFSGFFHELRSQYESPLKRDFILWNNKEILIDKKPVFWKPWYDKNVFFIKDLLTDSGDFLSFNQFKEKYNIETNFLQYYQMISAIPSILKQKSAEQGDSQMNELSTKNTFFLSENKLINFDEFRCK